ncbi:MAG: hypothetical protein Q9226_007221 [Calogaya cf. arnoldii]
MSAYLRNLRTKEQVLTAIVKEARRYYNWMRDVSEQDYYNFAMSKAAERINANRIVTPPTSQQFWKAVYDYGTLGPNAQDDPNDLLRLIATGLAGPYTIGKLYGRITLKLLPAIGALPASDMFDPGDPMRTRFKAEHDDKLRRFAAFGWVLMQDSGGIWQRTGHVMVVDMDDRNDAPDDGFTFYAPEIVRRDDPTQAGVFPGDNNRTPICRIIPHGRKEEKGEIILSKLGENFSFAPERKGGHRDWRQTDKGPALARVMDWYWDPQTEEKVCYNKQGREWYRYSPRSRDYYFSDLDLDALEGEIGLFGALYGLPVAEIPIEQRKGYEENQQALLIRGYDPAAAARARNTPRRLFNFPGY